MQQQTRNGRTLTQREYGPNLRGMGMGILSGYWRWFRVDRLGHSHSQEIPEAKTFMQQHFGQVTSTDEQSHQQIQQQLMQWQSDPDRRKLTQICLCCFISYHLKEFCYRLEQHFGSVHGLKAEELLPSVLDWDLNTSDSQSLTHQILTRFDPVKGNLSTWTNRMAKSDRDVKQILLLHGIEQITDWSLLNQTTVGQLQRLLSERNYCDQISFLNSDRLETQPQQESDGTAEIEWRSTPVEIEHRLNLLQAYHRVYRAQILATRDRASRKRYPEPSLEQLSQIAITLELGEDFDPQEILWQLQRLAKLLRQDRINRKRQPRSLTKPDPQPNDVAIASEEQINLCLGDGVKQVIEHRLEGYKPKKNTSKAQEKAKIKIVNFLKALYWFHGEGILMSEIAQRLGLNDQPRVSRLLQLKQLRSDIRRKTVRCLCDRITQLAQTQGFINPDRLRDLDAKIEQVLGDRIDRAITEDQKTASTGKAYRQASKLSQIICQYLETAVFKIDNHSFNIYQLIKERPKC